MGWHPDPEDRAAWSTAGGVLLTAGAGAAIAWLAIAEPTTSREPLWPVFAFGALALIGLYGMLAPLLRWRPWHRQTGNAEMNRLMRSQFRAIKRQRFVRSLLPWHRDPISKETHLMLTTEPPPLLGDERVEPARGASYEAASQYQAGKLAAESGMTPLERWLQGRIEVAKTAARERVVRGDATYLTHMGKWDTENVDELMGGVAPELADSYRADPRNPEEVDGIEPPHTVTVQDAYFDRRLQWLKNTLNALRSDAVEPPRDLKELLREGVQLGGMLEAQPDAKPPHKDDPVYRWARATWLALRHERPLIAKDFFGDKSPHVTAYFATAYGIEVDRIGRRAYLDGRVAILARVIEQGQP